MFHVGWHVRRNECGWLGRESRAVGLLAQCCAETPKLAFDMRLLESGFIHVEGECSERLFFEGREDLW